MKDNKNDKGLFLLAVALIGLAVGVSVFMDSDSSDAEDIQYTPVSSDADLAAYLEAHGGDSVMAIRIGASFTTTTGIYIGPAQKLYLDVQTYTVKTATTGNMVDDSSTVPRTLTHSTGSIWYVLTSGSAWQGCGIWNDGYMQLDGTTGTWTSLNHATLSYVSTDASTSIFNGGTIRGSYLDTSNGNSVYGIVLSGDVEINGATVSAIIMYNGNSTAATIINLNAGILYSSDGNQPATADKCRNIINIHGGEFKRFGQFGSVNVNYYGGAISKWNIRTGIGNSLNVYSPINDNANLSLWIQWSTTKNFNTVVINNHTEKRLNIIADAEHDSVASGVTLDGNISLTGTFNISAKNEFGIKLRNGACIDGTINLGTGTSYTNIHSADTGELIVRETGLEGDMKVVSGTAITTSEDRKIVLKNVTMEGDGEGSNFSLSGNIVVDGYVATTGDDAPSLEIGNSNISGESGEIVADLIIPEGTTANIVSGTVNANNISAQGTINIGSSTTLDASNVTVGEESEIVVSSGAELSLDSVDFPSGTTDTSTYINTEEGSTVGVNSVKEGGADSTSLADTMFEKIYESGAGGSIGTGDEVKTINSIAYMSYKNTLAAPSVTWLSSQAAPAVASDYGMDSLMPADYSFLGWSTEFKSYKSTGWYVGESVDPNFTAGLAPTAGNGNFVLYPVYTKTVTEDTAQYIVDGVFYELKEDAFAQIKTGSMVYITPKCSELLKLRIEMNVDYTLVLPAGQTVTGSITTTNSSGETTGLTLKEVLIGSDGLTINVGSMVLAGSFTSGTATLSHGILKVSDYLNILDKAKLLIDGQMDISGKINLSGTLDFAEDAYDASINNKGTINVTSLSAHLTTKVNNAGVINDGSPSSQSGGSDDIVTIMTSMKAQKNAEAQQSASSSSDNSTELIAIAGAAVAAMAIVMLAVPALKKD